VFWTEYTINCSRNLGMSVGDRLSPWHSRDGLTMPKSLEVTLVDSSVKSRSESPCAQLGAAKIELASATSIFYSVALSSPLVTSPVDNSIPVNMSPSNTPASMAATSQDIEMLLAAQVRATVQHTRFVD
jgi:hypothetical protein